MALANRAAMPCCFACTSVTNDSLDFQASCYHQVGRGPKHVLP